MKPVILLTFVLLSILPAGAKSIRVDANAQPLDQLLRTLPVSISFDAAAVSAFRITVHKTYPDIVSALDELLRDKNLRWEKSGDVYIIQPTTEKKRKTGKLPLKILLLDKQTLLPLPYASGIAAGGLAIADEKGVILLKTDKENELSVHCSSLGYTALDTLLTPGTHRVYLSPAFVPLNTVTVNVTPESQFMQTGRKAGEINLNQQIAPFMAGSRDNSVFTMLRMMPGVRASGEALDELMVWGSTGGESAVYFDGIHLFGMRAFNTQISYVNPYLVSGIQLLKQGGNMENGGQTGAIAHLIAADGNPQKPELRISLNNNTGNIYASVPLGNRMVLSVAGRKSLFDFFLASRLKQPSRDSSNYFIQPNYNFRDANIRLNGQLFERDKFSIGFYRAADQFAYRFSDPSYPLEGASNSDQWGMSFSYQRLWKGGATSQLYGTYSQQDAYDETTFPGEWTTSMHNVISETRAGLTHTMLVGSFQQLNIGVQLTNNDVALNEKRKAIRIPSAFLSDRISVGKLMLEGGVRADYNMDGDTENKWYFQPRINASYRPFPFLTFTASHNVAMQYVARQAVMGIKDSISQAWVARASNPLRSEVSTFGISGICKDWLISTEIFEKRLKNAYRLFYQQITANDMTFYGLDFSLRRNIGLNKVFGSYSVMKQLHGVPELSHEIKGGTLLQWRNFYFSANYVVGLGFLPQTIGAQNLGSSGTPAFIQETDSYQRIDAGLTYRQTFSLGELSTGISLLNLLNSHNTRYNYYLDTSNKSINISTGATPFTALLFVEFKF